MILEAALERLVKIGTLTVTFPNGSVRSFGPDVSRMHHSRSSVPGRNVGWHEIRRSRSAKPIWMAMWSSVMETFSGRSISSP